MNRLCKNFYKIIMSEYDKYDPIFIYYGSNIYNENNNDLDVCLIFKKKLSYDTQQRLIERTIQFQKNNGLKIDEEVPFSNKLIYTFDEIEDIFIHSPFIKNGKYKLGKIVKSKTFLSSKKMKQRLMLNILTTDHRILNDKHKKIKIYEKKAWFEIFKMIKNVFATNIRDIYLILDHLYINPITHYGGEMHLGYKLSNSHKIRYLKRKVKIYSKKFIKDIDKQEKIN